MPAKRKSLLDGLLYFLNSLLALGLLFSYLAYYVSPEHTPFFAYFSTLYPALLVANVIFAVYWILRGKTKVILPVVCIALGYAHLGRTYQFSGKHKVVNSGATLKVMSFNVRLFNKYNWIEESEVPQKIKTLIEEEDPDVVFLQEYYAGEQEPDLGYPHRYEKFTNEGKNWGLVICSKLPLENLQSQPIAEDMRDSVHNKLIYADINWKDKPLRLVNVHLQSVGLERKDYERLTNPNQGSSEEIQREFEGILKRLGIAFRKRAYQIEGLVQTLEESPHALIVGGDFNDVPTSFTYHKVDEILQDGFVEAGTGMGRTYAKGPLPLRIDYLFHSEQLRANRFKTLKEELSDHYPIVAEYEFR